VFVDNPAVKAFRKFEKHLYDRETDQMCRNIAAGFLLAAMQLLPIIFQHSKG
jgi:hypothetical protein